MNESPNPKPSQEPAPPEGTTLWQTIASVGAALFGVQSRKNRERDFTHGKPLHFILVGIAMTLVVIFALTLIVKLLLHHAGA
ncbi:MAG: DUF2970 domain-containing protein [Stenotrophobium sp.]